MLSIAGVGKFRINVVIVVSIVFYGYRWMMLRRANSEPLIQEGGRGASGANGQYTEFNEIH